MLFRAIAEQGHYAGRSYPSTTRQGIYACTASGRLLGSINTHSAAKVAAMLEEALAQWAALPAEERAPAAPGAPGWRFRALYPEDGLVLRVHSRDLPRDEGACPQPEDWRAHAANEDHAWFRRAEAACMVPRPAAAGARCAWPDGLVRRLARLHLVDNVRGQVLHFEPEHVEEAWLDSTIAAVEGPLVAVEMEGHARLRARGTWAVDGYRDRDDPAVQERGIDVRLLGRAVFDHTTGRFIAFELVAAGTRHGGTQYNARGDDLAAAPIGFALTLAEPGDRVEPASFWEYHWR